ncbi:dolichyl-phosphate-mannose--protein mannosyltransferase [Nostoc sphaeroides CCNUC1]|uniref:Dolichyl-phosphate-mannose--protein mannosyltransferase n=1 Tax=Nostoc sphaeroides CCNUC1 TaxID=2653204 RepID=A0A5P8VZF7_9NOSO|nr:dolichyl-phosphate-mannose--protein mannosyltransferase [Nostoc sphaeroides CCNUC1]
MPRLGYIYAFSIRCVKLLLTHHSNPKTTLTFHVRELQEINYPLLWGGQHERPMDWALMLPTPQELIGYFFIWKPLMWKS